MIDNLTVITDNLGYLLLGRTAQGEPGGALLSVLMTLGAAVLAFPGGVLLACCAWRFAGWPRKLLFLWAELIRGIPLIFVIFWLWFCCRGSLALTCRGLLPSPWRWPGLPRRRSCTRRWRRLMHYRRGNMRRR